MFFATLLLPKSSTETKYSSNSGTCGKHYMMCLFEWGIIGTLRSDDGGGYENVKKRNRFKQNNNFARAWSFLYISLPSLHDYDVKMPIFAFYGGRIQGTAKFFFWTWTWFLRIQLQESSSTFGEAIRVGIITIKTDGTRIQFLSDVFAAVAVLRS